ncbi:hypothetical protein D9758_012852 [Tetrapyrgos nigripes]|uniref:Uncharacterized protein n=1 Tax=Tetrapyrgos nigripes TaxID=182062 RepID=A0A8H5CAQ5_9AGAR|nr:hypothetical protein D9758_012852 [Tetrapyrgos nigripes]
MLFSSAFVFASLLGTSFAAPLLRLPKRKLADLSTGGVPGSAFLADDAFFAQNECNIQVNPGDLVFLISRAFLKNSAPGSSAADNGLCGRSDATIFVLDGNEDPITENTSALAPVGICEECAEGDVVVNLATFNELGGDPTTGVINNVFPRFG